MYYNFNPLLEKPFCFIHPYQLSAVYKLLSFELPTQVDYIILFGGSLDLACHINSDIDLLVISEFADLAMVYDEMHVICRDIDRPFDILVSSKDDFIEESSSIGSVEYNIKRTGVIIYAKEKTDTVG